MQPVQTAPSAPIEERSEIMWPNTPNAPVRPTEPVAFAQPLPQAPAAPPAKSSYVVTSDERTPGGSATSRAAQIIYLLLGISEALMIARFALKLLAANADVGFVRFVYGVSAPLITPFQGIFATPTSQSNVVELSSLVAIAVYAVVAWALVRVVLIIGRQGGMPAAH
jgi:hypothetical protein